MIMFSSYPSRWKPESIRATQANIQEAIGYVNLSNADGSTNIYDSLVDALNILNSTQSNSLASMIVFMTDGQPNAGAVTDSSGIVTAITNLNKGSKFVIHSIAFGNDADFGLVQRLSASNFGLARKVYEDLDADLQLTGFYSEISSPLLTDVKIEYLNETVDVRSLVQDHSYNYYDGGELVVLGKLSDDQPELVTFDAQVNARGASGRVNLQSRAQSFICPRHPIITVDDSVEPCCMYPRCPRPIAVSTTERPVPGASTVGGFVERMWAYQTIKKLLKDAELGSGNETEKKQEALRLSLKYHFVTEMTSMVVVQPDQNATSLEKVQPRQDRMPDYGGYNAPQFRTIAATGRAFSGSRSGGASAGIRFAPARQLPTPAFAALSAEEDEDVQEGSAISSDPLPEPEPVPSPISINPLSDKLLIFVIKPENRTLVAVNYTRLFKSMNLICSRIETSKIVLKTTTPKKFNSTELCPQDFTESLIIDQREWESNNGSQRIDQDLEMAKVKILQENKKEILYLVISDDENVNEPEGRFDRFMGEYKMQLKKVDDATSGDNVKELEKLS